MLRVAVAMLLVLVFTVTACTHTGPKYRGSANNVAALKPTRTSSARQVAVGSFTSFAPGLSAISCRGLLRVTPSDSSAYEKYIENAVTSELKLAGIFDQDSAVRLKGHLDNITFNSFPPGVGNWQIDMTFDGEGISPFKINVSHVFPTSVFAPTACAEVANTLTAAVQSLIAKLIDHPSFKKLSFRAEELSSLRVGEVSSSSRPPAAGFQHRPKLYVLAIGVSSYQQANIPKLDFPAKDARDFAAVMQRQKGKLYEDVQVMLLTEAAATRDNIADAFDWLQRQVTQHDVAMLFIAGHGVNDPDLGYTFLPVNADLRRLRRTGVTTKDITTTLSGRVGKWMVFLDTCHAGNVLGPGLKARAGFIDITGVINELTSAESGAVVFSSSTGRQLSLEKSDWGNGAFTKALVEGLGGRADFQRSGRITFKMLDLYVTERVKELTQGKQSPVTQAPGGVNDFPLAVVEGSGPNPGRSGR